MVLNPNEMVAMHVNPPERWLIAVLIGLMCLGAAPLHTVAQHLAAARATTTIRVIQTRDDGMLLEMNAPPPALTVIHHAGQSVTTLTLPGALIDDQPGSPRLPIAGAWVAIPPGRTATMRVVEDEQTFLALPAPLLINRADAPIGAARAAADAGMEPLVLDGAAPAADAVLASAAGASSTPPAVIANIEMWRSQTVARLLFRPLQLAVDSDHLLAHRRLVVALDFVDDRTSSHPAYAAAVDEGAFEPVLQAMLLNYAQGRVWRRRPIDVGQRAATQENRRWRVRVPVSGMVRIDCADLAAAGAPVETTPPTHWRVQRDGKTGPAVATGALGDNGDARCDAGESLFFYAYVQPTRYAADGVFWLSAASDSGVIIDDITPPSVSLSQEIYVHRDRYETNRLYYSYIPLAEDAEHWYWDILTPAISITHSYPFTVSELAATGEAQVSVALAGYDGAHVTQLAVNEQVVAQSAWNGRQPYTITATLPITRLQAGVNTVRISALGPAPDLQYVDAFTIAYPRQLTAQVDRLFFTALPGRRLTLDGFSTSAIAVYSLADFDHPRRVAATVATPCPCRVTFDTPMEGEAPYLALTAASYLTPTAITAAPVTDLLSPTDGADYLILAPAELAEALDPLVAQRRTAGLRVRVIDVQAIYDDFGDGRPDPTAIQRFLNYTLTTWPAPAPAYVLLVGDGSYDPRGYQTPPPPSTLPAYLRFVDPVIGETASDNRYVAATPESQLPQMMVGRLPARTPAEVAAIVAKILAFEGAGADAAWRRQAVIVADNAFESNGRPDPAGNFWALADRAATQLITAGVAVERLYFNPCAASTAPACDLPDPPYPRFGDAAALTAAFRSSVRAGRGLVIYTGHASPLSWAGAPSLLRTGDAPGLGNREHPFVALEMSCYTGFFHGPYDALSELLVRTPESGAVATWSSSGQSPLRGQDVLLEQFLTTLLADPAAGMTLGQAVLTAKLYLYRAGGGVYDSALDVFHLFGDPALVLRVAAPTPTPPSAPTPPPALTTEATPVATATDISTPIATATLADSASPTLPASPVTTPVITPSPVATPWQFATHTPAPSSQQLFLPAMQASTQEGG